MTAEQGWLTTVSDGGMLLLVASGCWNLGAATGLGRALDAVCPAGTGSDTDTDRRAHRIKLDLGGWRRLIRWGRCCCGSSATGWPTSSER